MNGVLVSLERLAMAWTLGGGSVLALAFRPLALRGQAPGTTPKVATAVERISVGTWNRFNRLSLGSTLVVAAAEVLRAALGVPVGYLRLSIAALMALALLYKLRVDARLMARAESQLASAVRGGVDPALDRQHRV